MSPEEAMWGAIGKDRTRAPYSRMPGPLSGPYSNIKTKGNSFKKTSAPWSYSTKKKGYSMGKWGFGGMKKRSWAGMLGVASIGAGITMNRMGNSKNNTITNTITSGAIAGSAMAAIQYGAKPAARYLGKKGHTSEAIGLMKMSKMAKGIGWKKAGLYGGGAMLGLGLARKVTGI